MYVVIVCVHGITAEHLRFIGRGQKRLARTECNCIDVIWLVAKSSWPTLYTLLALLQFIIHTLGWLPRNNNTNISYLRSRCLNNVASGCGFFLFFRGKDVFSC